MSRTNLPPAMLFVLLAAAAPARGGIISPISLGVIVLDAKTIVVLEVEEFLPERGLVVYKKVAELKGKHADQRVRHGRVPVRPEPDANWKRSAPPLEVLAELLSPGRRAVFFHDGSSGVVYLGEGCWYSGRVGEDGATANWGIWLPQYGFGYAGTVESLQDHVRAMLQRKEVVVPAFAATPAASDQLFSMLVEPRRLALPMWQIRAGLETLGLPAGTPERFAQGYGTELNEEAKKLVVAKGSGRAADVEKLTAGLKHAKANVRRRHADELGLIGPQAKPAEPALAVLLKDDEPSVRLAAATALVRIVPGHRAAGTLLLGELQDKSTSRRLEGVDALWSLELAVPATVPALAAALDDPDKQVRQRAASALRSLLRAVRSADPVTAADLVVALKTKDESVRRLAVCALRYKPAPEVKSVLPDMVKLLKDSDSWVRVEAAGTLARFDPKHEAVVPVLVEILNDKTHKQVWPGGMIRKAALDALGRVGPAARPAVPVLIEAIEELWEVQEVVGILRQLGPEAKPAVAVLQGALMRPLPRHSADLPILAAAALAHVAPHAPDNEPAVALLIATAKDRQQWVHHRVLAVEALGRFGAATALPALQEASKDPFEEVRKAAATALKQVQGK